MERLPETCSEILATLPLFAGYDLEAPEMEAVAAHLERCEGCRDACERARRAREVLGSLRDDGEARGASPDLWAGVRSQLVTEGLLSSGPRVARPSVSSRWWMGSAAAAAVVLIVGLLGRPDAPNQLGQLGQLGPSGPEGFVAGPQAASEGDSVPPVQLEAVALENSPASGSEGINQRSEWVGGAVSKPVNGQLVGNGLAPTGSRIGQPRATTARDTESVQAAAVGRALRPLQPGEAGLLERAQEERAARDVRLFYVMPCQGRKAQRELSGIR